MGINIFTANEHIVRDIIEQCKVKVDFIVGGQAVKFMYPEILNFATENNMHIIIGEGEYIIRQGEVGDVFYIIEEGEAVAFGSKDHGKASIPEMNYSKGNYFGELSLLRDQPRAANVKAKTDVKLLALDRNSFKRVLGPIDVILKRNAEKYKKFVNHGK